MPDQSERETEKSDGIRQLISYGAEISGGAAGAALGWFVGGPVGAVVGGAGGPMAAIALKNLGQEIIERQLGTREKMRVGAAFAIAAADIRERIEAGESLREDGFFHEKQSGRSDAEEVAEHVLLKAQREPEEKKIQYMGYLLSSIAFDSEINVYMAHQLIKIADQFTYRQLCILKLCVVKDNFGLRDKDYAGLGRMTLRNAVYSLLTECLDLCDREYIDVKGAAVIFPINIVPKHMHMKELGSDLFHLMKLSLIADEDIVPIAAQLK